MGFAIFVNSPEVPAFNGYLKAGFGLLLCK